MNSERFLACREETNQALMRRWTNFRLHSLTCGTGASERMSTLPSLLQTDA